MRKEESDSTSSDEEFRAAWGESTEGTEEKPIDIRKDGTILKITLKKGYGHDRPQEFSQVIASFGDISEKEWILDEEPTIPEWVDETLKSMRAGEVALVKLVDQNKEIRINLSTFQLPRTLEEQDSQQKKLEYIRMLRDRGNYWYQEKDYARARRRYHNAGLLADVADFYQEATIALLNLSAIALAEKDYIECRDLCCRVLARDSKNIKAFYRRAVALSAVALYDEAYADVKLALKSTHNKQQQEQFKKLCKSILEKRKAAKAKQKNSFGGFLNKTHKANATLNIWDNNISMIPKKIEHRPGSRVFLDICFDLSINHLQRIVIELFEDTAPLTTRKFKSLCGIYQNNQPFSYRGTTFHRVIHKFMIQGGKIHNYFDSHDSHEPFFDSHTTPGLLSMSSDADSQFFILTKPAPHLDGKHRVFGRVHDSTSMAIVHGIEQLEVDNKYRPLTEPHILNCGLLPSSSCFVQKSN
mmetsp:Transcript_19331/g.29346  ORF Transcript_19331/g.29346 Transcript_19331/m.29346 type:complete len:470 (+) Transcript_19331:23-1432(+)